MSNKSTDLLPAAGLSIVKGPSEPPLQQLTLGQFIDQGAEKFGSKPAIIVPWSGARLSYHELNERTKNLAKGLLAFNIRKGDRVAIFSCEDERVVELFFATARIGAIIVLLNKTYTIQECDRAIRHADVSLLFLGDVVNHRTTRPLLKHLSTYPIPGLKHIALTRWDTSVGSQWGTWDDILRARGAISADTLREAEQAVHCKETIIFQFTSGTTGNPKASMLSHYNLVNNAHFVGERLNLTPDDVVCCPPPLFHVFGLVGGILVNFTYGASVVLPAREFDATATVEALIKERCTVLHGVPTMFSAILQNLHQSGTQVKTVRTGIVAGTKVPPALLTQIQEELEYDNIAISYGMTETSPVTFMTAPLDGTEQKMETVGTVFPHVLAKVVDKKNGILPRGSRGELCVSGYLLQKGYYKNPEKTAEVMIRDENGALWMHTGDEASIDRDGYCQITGRIKDVIIRGGENVYPEEIEERLTSHPAIDQASVVGLKDEKYGEVISAFIQSQHGQDRPTLNEIKDWVRQELGRHKAPAYIQWVGPGDPISQYPTTGSGKIRKDILRDIGNEMVEDAAKIRAAKL
ncbi:Acyl-CoA synthetase member 2 mitochondrial [Arachnomyces sp. PD_36]|nr:Acyl-CoA synthetase member 2 mitochondrial [Arachnomyces sp. PD_36]